MSRRSFHRFWFLALTAWATAGAEESAHLTVPQMEEVRPFLRRERPPYRNFVFNPFTHYADHTWGQRRSGIATRLNMREVERAHALWSPLGDYVTTGYDLYTWVERRQPEQRWGSELFKDWASWSQEFTNLAVARDGYRDWGFVAVVGDGLIARFTPLTLSMTDYNGLRLDFSLPRLKFTGLGSRISRPNRESYLSSENAAEIEIDHGTLLAGGRVQADIGVLTLGMNGVNLHSYNSIQPGNSSRGMLRLDQPIYEWIIVRFGDDAPMDGRPGATVQDVLLFLNGQARPDLQPRVVRHLNRVPSQVGRTLSSGDFLPVFYNSYNSPPNYYQGRRIPYYGDYLYLLAHAEGQDVSKATHLDGLLANFALVEPEGILYAGDGEQLVYLFDLSGESQVESVEVEAVLSNDYRVEWAGLFRSPDDPTSEKLEVRYESTFWRPALRARGNVEDGSNLRRVRFKVGENTAIFTYSADIQLKLPGLEVEGEYARSAVYGRYPAHVEGTPAFTASPRFAHRGSAYFLNALKKLGRGRLGAEFFSMSPDFSTEMETYLRKDYGYSSSRGYSPFAGLANDTVVWRLVQDNEDGDRWPDVMLGNILGSPQTFVYRTLETRDGDGTFLGQDEDSDGIVDTDRNFNGIPDYDETFLMYSVEPNEYVYGLDRNNNDEPDQREDDWEVDYPYDADQRGLHLFGQVFLGRHGSLGLGRYAVEGQASGGRSHSTYALLSYRREGVASLRRLFFENQLRRVKDDIADGFNQFSRAVRLQLVDELDRPGRGVFQDVVGRLERRPDRLFYQDSVVNETYLEGVLRLWSALNTVHKVRLRLNWQQGGRLSNGLFQRQRRLDFWAWTSRADYTWQWGRLRAVPQFKFLLLRLIDREDQRVLRSEYRVIPILKLRYALMSRTELQMGVHGWGPLPYRLADRTERRNSLEQRTAVITLTNNSRYFGYDMHTILGLRREELNWDDRFQRFRNFDGWSFFVRTLIGFTEFGQFI